MRPAPAGLMALIIAATTLTGCGSAPDVQPRPQAQAPAQVSPVATPTPTASPTPTPEAPPPPRPTPSTHPTDSPKAGKASGPITDEPVTFQNIPVVSKDHRLSASYVPPWVNQPHGLHPDATAAFAKLQAAAKTDGLTLTIRSGYRDHATQHAGFLQAMREYDEKTARLYFAEGGASEHQTGLALDAWDGRNRGTAFAQLPHAAWLAEHAHEFGFIIRYPQDKTHITGYAWESWHLRWVGPEISAQFGPNSDLTLEEFLGLA